MVDVTSVTPVSYKKIFEELLILLNYLKGFTKLIVKFDTTNKAETTYVVIMFTSENELVEK